MVLNDLKTGTKLKLGFGIIVVLIVILATVAYNQTKQQASQTENLYNHPLVVRQAIGDLNIGIENIHKNMKDLFLAENEAEIEIILQKNTALVAHVFENFDIVEERFLGEKEHVEIARNEFVKWNAIRDETIRLLRSGNLHEAAQRTKPNGAGGIQAENVIRAISVIDSQARNFADKFYTDSVRLEKQLHLQLLLFTLIIIAFSILVVVFLSRSINIPLVHLTNFAKLFREGNRKVRSGYVSKNEFGNLSDSFNDMANKIERELLLGERVTHLSTIMLREDEIHSFCKQLLGNLLEQTEAQMGAVYLLNSEKNMFEKLECIGMNAESCRSFSGDKLEGEFGAAIASGKMQHIQSIPDDCSFTFVSVAGDFKPREIITLPVVANMGTIAIISLATLRLFSLETIQLLQSITNTLSARMSGVITYQQVKEMTEKLITQNELLEKQKIQISEIGAYNRSLLEASLDSLVTIDPDGKITDVNKATEQITGRTRNELIGTNVADYFTDPDLAKAGYLKVFQEKAVRDYELAVLHKNGTVTPVYYNASVYCDTNNNVIGVFAAARDITERKKAEQELKRRAEILAEQNIELEAQKTELASQSHELAEQNAELEIQKQQLNEANRLKSVFLSNMSHELRTPLNSVIALSGVLNRRLADKIPHDEYSYIEVIGRNGKHLLSLINDILDLSRIEAGKEVVDISVFNLNNLIADLTEMLQPQAEQKNLQLIHNNRNEEIKVASDAAKCRHILQNLIGNAIKFTETGKVEITTFANSTSITVKVADTGIGILPEHREHIFNEFTQADGSTSRRFGGTGLGLAIARKYAQLLNGFVEVESELGSGSVFTLTLPLKFSDKIDAPAGNESITQHMKSKITGIKKGDFTKTILVIEDSEPAVIQIKDALDENGFKVIVASDGIRALEMIKEQKPDGIILDLMMPGIDGFEVLRKLRTSAENGLTPVLILTAKQVTKEELSFLKGNNISQLIQKGDVNLNELISAVTQMVHKEPEYIEKTVKKPRLIKEKPTILIVEDNLDNMLTARVLLQEDYVVFEATDGKQGVEMAIKHVPDLILMDISLPELDGISAFKQIRNTITTCNIPVIALTASALISDREQILAEGFDAFVAKPIDEDQFFSTIKQTLYDYL